MNYVEQCLALMASIKILESEFNILSKKLESISDLYNTNDITEELDLIETSIKTLSIMCEKLKFKIDYPCKLNSTEVFIDLENLDNTLIGNNEINLNKSLKNYIEDKNNNA